MAGCDTKPRFLWSHPKKTKKRTYLNQTESDRYKLKMFVCFIRDLIFMTHIGQCINESQSSHSKSWGGRGGNISEGLVT